MVRSQETKNGYHNVELACTVPFVSQFLFKMLMRTDKLQSLSLKVAHSQSTGQCKTKHCYINKELCVPRIVHL